MQLLVACILKLAFCALLALLRTSCCPDVVAIPLHLKDFDCKLEGFSASCRSIWAAKQPDCTAAMQEAQDAVQSGSDAGGQAAPQGPQVMEFNFGSGGRRSNPAEPLRPSPSTATLSDAVSSTAEGSETATESLVTPA